jgi:hypothetical protein
MVAPVSCGRTTWAHRTGVWALLLCALLLTLSSASPASAAVVTRGPYLQLATDDSIVIRWRTDTATDSRVEYGDAPGSLIYSESDPTATTEHIITLTGLSDDTRYFYSVGSTTEVLAGDNADHFFYTNPIPGTRRPIRAWLIGDSGYGSQNQADVRDAYHTYNGSTRTDLWLHVGDVSQSQGTDAQYQTEFFDMYPILLRQSVFWPTHGNHDSVYANSSTQSGPYYDNYTLPAAGEAGGVASGTEAYYSYDYANIHFVVLNSTDVPRTTGSAMLDWLAADLADTAQDWIIAYWHHPPYSKASHDSDAEIELIEMRMHALPILEDYGVDLVFSGHSAAYERTYLLDGHYGPSSDLRCMDNDTPGDPGDDYCEDSPSTPCPNGAIDCDFGGFIVDGGDGREGGDGAYWKPLPGPDPHRGTVYTVAGTAGQVQGGNLDHPAMYISWNLLGSVVLDIDGDRFDAIFLDSTGSVQDSFTVVKGVDLDTDGVPDDQDNCPGVYNPGQEDTVHPDGVGDACDDPDSDGVFDDEDNCPDESNADQADADSDDLGDVCDDCPNDPDNNIDGDNYCGDVDNCPTIPNNGQQDRDEDGLGDACDDCPYDPDNDIDSDSVCGDIDICPSDPDNDVDSDGICVGSGFNPPATGEFDNCPATYNPSQADADSDGRGDPCDATMGVTVLKRITVTGVADRMSSASYTMNVTSAPVAGTSGVCPAGTTGSLGFWSFKAPTNVPMLLTLDKTFNTGSGVFDVELTWTGRSTQFEIYRNTTKIALVDPGNLWRTTTLCDETDQNATPFDILFYSVIE